MHAITIDTDERRSLRWQSTPDPELGPGQVLVRAAATAVNRADLLQRIGRYPVPKGASEILGLEVAGTIEAVGESVRGWTPGDRVCALLEGGGYAEKVAIDASMLLSIPKSMRFKEAAALPEVLYTAFLNLYIEAETSEDDVVLVHAGASGVGTAAIQLCRAFGQRCFATASGAKGPSLLSLGAERAIDRHEESFLEVVRAETGGRGVDVILDPVGGSYLDGNLQALARGGRLVNIGLLGGARAELDLARLLTRRLRVIGSVLRSRTRAEKLMITDLLRTRLWPLVESGEVRPVVHTVLPIQAAESAHDLLAANATIGKVVLSIE